MSIEVTAAQSGLRARKKARAEAWGRFKTSVPGMTGVVLLAGAWAAGAAPEAADSEEARLIERIEALETAGDARGSAASRPAPCR